MDAIVQTVIGAAWLVLATGLAWSAFRAVQRVRSQDGAPPFFRMLSRRGVSVTQAEEAVGISELSRAVRRCVLCSGNEACRANLAGHEADCPNAGVLERVR
jgi:hypothetical protein